MNFVTIIKERKIIDGKLYRRYFTDSAGVDVGIPIGISVTCSTSRNYVGNMNYVLKNKPGYVACLIPYHDKLSQEAALKEAIKNTEYIADKTVSTAPKANKPKKVTNPTFFKDFDKSKLPPGVSIHHVPDTGKVIFNICHFDEKLNKFKNKSMYVGNVRTWRLNLDTVMEKAILLRSSTLARYKELTNQA